MYNIFMIILEIIGWIGTACIVLAYALVSSRKIRGSDNTYQLLNLCGACGVAINVFLQQAWPAFALQIIWFLIALSAIIKNLYTKK